MSRRETSRTNDLSHKMNDQVRTPSKKTLPHQPNLTYFSNDQFSRSFNSLILDDTDDQFRVKKSLNKSPPFNIKQGVSIEDAVSKESIDLYSDGYYTEEDIELSSNDGIRAASNKDPAHTPSDTNNSAFTSKKPKMKRSTKYFNLSIDSNFSPSSNSKGSFSPAVEKSTPVNKFKRPHKLVSQSPTNSPNNIKFKAVLDASSPSKVERNSLATNKLRIKSPLRLATSSAASSPRDFSLRKTLKSPNMRFRGSSSPIASHVFDEYHLKAFDESPSRNKKAGSLNFHIFNDEDEVGAPPKRSRNNSQTSYTKSSIHDENKENKNSQPKSFKSTASTSYKFVKPLQTAFESAGLMKKNSIGGGSKKLPPETPMKKNPLILINNKEKNSHLEFEDSFLNTDNSIEVGRNANLSSYSHSNSSNSSFFKFPSATKPATKRNEDFDISFGVNLDLDTEVVPETPTKSSSRGNHFANILKEAKAQAPLILPEEGDPCTPISHIPSDSIISSQVTLNFGNGAREDIQIDRTINGSAFNKDHERDQIQDLQVPEKDRSDEHLMKKFGRSNIRFIGKGQFSIAFECFFGKEKYAIKRNRKPVLGSHEKKAMLREIETLRALTVFNEGETDVEEGKENLVFFVEAWSYNNYYYIMTEFCEGGTLSDFLDEHKNYKLDEFRVWKILIEILSGLSYIHSKNYLHLDLKPANIFVTFDGSLKIGDFGLSTKLPILEKDFDIEGDRNYIAPELINDKIYTPFADIFSVGLIILEIATNIILPGNGTPWRKLRSGDLSDAGKLSSDNISDFLNHNNFSSLTSYNSSFNSINIPTLGQQHHSMNNGMYSGSGQAGLASVGESLPSLNNSSGITETNIRELIPKGAPEFLLKNTHSLDRLVVRMLTPNPFDRPTASDILHQKECLEIEDRRKAGATIFEGEFGPNDD